MSRIITVRIEQSFTECELSAKRRLNDDELCDHALDAFVGGIYESVEIGDVRGGVIVSIGEDGNDA